MDSQDLDPQAMTLERVYGVSTSVRGGAISLSTPGRNAVCYIAAHTAILHDCDTGQQTPLQGHCNSISSLATIPDRSVVITADIGPESLVVMWDSLSGQPIFTMPAPGEGGTRTVDVSNDGAYMALLTAQPPARTAADAGAPGKGEAGPCQQLIVYSLLNEDGELAEPKVVAAGDVRARSPHRCVRFNAAGTQLVTNSRGECTFWAVHGSKCLPFPTSAGEDRAYSANAEFTVSNFIPATDMAVTGTVEGDVIVWASWDGAQTVLQRRALKIIRLHYSAITYIATCGDMVVTGGGDGFVRFFDPKMRLQAWFEEVSKGAITSVSFAAPTDGAHGHGDPALPEDPSGVSASTEEVSLNKFHAPDFIVCTAQHCIVSVHAAGFNSETGGPEPTTIVQGITGTVADVCAHPHDHFIAIVNTAGRLEVWDTAADALVHSCVLKDTVPTRVKYSRKGGVIAVGGAAGHLAIHASSDLRRICLLRNTRASIVHLDANAGGDQFVVGDGAGCVSLYSHERVRGVLSWEHIGKYRAHEAGLAGVAFCKAQGTEESLVSVGRDGSMAEYDLLKSTTATGLKMSRFHTAAKAPGQPVAITVPRKAAWLTEGHAGVAVLCADATMKLRVVDLARRCNRLTVLGPTFGGVPQQLVCFQAGAEGPPAVAYSTGDRVVGIAAGPLDGCPERSMGLIAHPGPVAGITVSNDGQFLFTAAAGDPVVNKWRVHADVLAGMAANRKGVERWAAALEGGLQGELYHEMVDYFYLCQVMSEGGGQTEPRHMSMRVPAIEVPDIMRALGVYLTKSEEQDVMAEVILLTGAQHADTAHVGLEDLIQLYVNHRPVASVQAEEIKSAFLEACERLAGQARRGAGTPPGTANSVRSRISNSLKNEDDEEGSDLGELEEGALEKEHLHELLTKYGEPLTEEEMLVIGEALFGMSSLEEALPDRIGPRQFTEEFLGFEVGEEGAA
ncbi:unnamed protein product [Pedinophyceae sp. YPF-701]|nr:unnamed protein product [Pedinophyceae sp. YPF-701]